MEDLKNLGFDFVLRNDQILFQNHKVCLMTLENLINNFNSFSFKNHRIIFSETENIKEDLKNNFRISLMKKHWFYKTDRSETINQEIISTYNFLKKKFYRFLMQLI